MKIEEIKKKMDELEILVDRSISEFDKKWFAEKRHQDHVLDDFKEYCKLREEYCGENLVEFRKLSIKYRMEKTPVLSPLPDYGDVMSLEDFIDCVNSGGFIDYDGYGHYVHDGQETDIIIYPSDVKEGNIRKDFKEIVWFNR